jgi:4-hydroxy-2-oxoheptanedioate aldolase
MRKNKLRIAMNERKAIFGMAVYSYSPTLVEVIGYSGFDFIFLDCEHTPLSVDSTLEHIIRSADVAGISVVLRVKGNDEHMIRNALEMGADGVVIPHLKTSSEAEKAVQAAKFPPQGIRGASAEVRSAQYGLGNFDWEHYVRKSNEDTVIIGLAEDREFFENIDEILSVDGLDMIDIGPTDLAMSMGLPLLYKTDFPEIQEALDMLIVKSKEKHKSLMFPAIPPTLEQAQKLVAKGIRAIILGNDLGSLKKVCQQYVDQVVIPLRSTNID